MNILEVSKTEYDKIATNPFSGFDKSDFVELNKHKADEVKYFIFNNGKNRFALVGGVKNKVLKCPFSATFGIFSEITTGNSIEYYQDAIGSLIEYCREKKYSKIQFNTPALCYGASHITKFQNALLNNGFKILDYDINFEYFPDDFDENYLTNIKRNARKNYNNALRHELVFSKTDDIKNVYSVIKINREFRGFPLWMSLDDVMATSKIIPSDYFIVTDKNGTPCASALVHNLKDNIVRVVYWGNTPESEEARPINFLSFNLFKYYKAGGKQIIDIGTSTVDGVPNVGLCDFKESIGCKCSPKINFMLEM